MTLSSALNGRMQVSSLQKNWFGACKQCEEFRSAVLKPAVKIIVKAPPHLSRTTVVVMYSLILVLGALKVCMVLLNGVEDHIADTAGVTAAQSWGDTGTGPKVTVRAFSCVCAQPLQKAAAAAPKVLPTVKILYRLAIKVLFLTLHCRRILLIRVHLEKIWLVSSLAMSQEHF